MAASGTGGSISPSSATVNNGNMATFTVTPSTGYGVGSVTGCGGTLSGNTYTTAAINGGCTVSADFNALGPIWKGGSNTPQQAGVYGSQGQPAATNVPGARTSAVAWTDTSGNFWVFGGSDSVADSVSGYLNDLWKYSPTTGEWTWESGSTTGGATGIYGTLNQPAATNVPGARSSAASWTDASGNLWLFGGYGDYSAGGYGALDDLWEYTPTTGEWTWKGGSETGGPIGFQAGVYGTQGQPAATNMPGARSSAVAWTDANGNLWLFGGIGYDSLGVYGDMNDLWEYTSATGEWTWKGGCNLSYCVGIYSAQGQASPGARPGARDSAVAWTDATGNFWLFGGSGYVTTDVEGILNDLWKYSPATGEWTWESGSETNLPKAGVYGTLHQPSATNVPGARISAVAWADASGNLWLFGGNGYDSTTTVVSTNQGPLNDLWKYTPSTGEWTWEGGSTTWGAAAVYGTLDQPAATNVPGARQSAVVWTDTSGNVWLFGGGPAFVSATVGGVLNDLWWLQASTLNGCSGFGCQ
jgi:N-acetylneuraminic acid mutarotase